MILQDIGTHLSTKGCLPSKAAQLEFTNCIYHVRETFFHFLKQQLRRRHFLPEAGKVNTMFGRDPNGREYFCCLSVASVWLPDFDFQQLFQSDASVRDAIVLNAISGTIRECAVRQNADVECIDTAEQLTIKSGYLVSYAIDRLGRSHPSRKFTLKVVRQIVSGGENWLLEIQDRSGELMETYPISDGIKRVRPEDVFGKSAWRGDTFSLINKRNKILFQKSMTKTVEKLAVS